MEVEHPIEHPHPEYCPVEGCKEKLVRVFERMTTILYAGDGWTGALGNGEARFDTKVVSEEANTPYE